MLKMMIIAICILLWYVCLLHGRSQTDGLGPSVSQGYRIPGWYGTVAHLMIDMRHVFGVGHRTLCADRLPMRWSLCSDGNHA